MNGREIIEYHRPETLDEALDLLAREKPHTLPLAGGSSLNKPNPLPIAVVDLQRLGLDGFEQQGNNLHLGATFTLQSLLEELEAISTLAALQQAIRHEATYNLRQVGTVAGTLVSADGRSPFTTAMLALDADIQMMPGEERIGLGDLLPLRSERLAGKLITRVTIPANARLAYHFVARSPADRPIVCAAGALWLSGRFRLALGGYGGSPSLVVDGQGASGAREAARSTYAEAGDQWATAEYRKDAAAVLAGRCAEELGAEI